jgi:uncharacterized protein YdaU (DUF1376 family)
MRCSVQSTPGLEVSMKPDLWLPLFVGDYLRDTQHLTTEQSGAYLHLLMGAWMRGGLLPADDAQLAMISRLPSGTWKKTKPVLAPFFQISGTSWIQKRLLAEYERATKVNEAKRENGKKGGRPPSKQKANQNPSTKLIETQLKPNGKANQKLIETPSQSQRAFPLSKDNEGEAPGSDILIWDVGVRIFKNAGCTEKEARQFLGKFAKDDKAKLAEIIGGMSVRPVVDPRAYVAAAMTPKERQVAA